MALHPRTFPRKSGGPLAESGSLRSDVTTQNRTLHTRRGTHKCFKTLRFCRIRSRRKRRCPQLVRDKRPAVTL